MNTGTLPERHCRHQWRVLEAQEAAQEALYVKCSCGEYRPPEDIEYYGKIPVCKDCEKDFLESAFYRFGQSYLHEHAPEFLRWWFESLAEKEQERLLLTAYLREKTAGGTAYRPDDERDFCLGELFCWREYVQKRME